MNKNIGYFELLKWYFREELRLYTTLFGLKRFLLFPVIIFAFSIIMGVSIPMFDVSLVESAIIYGTIITLFGLQTGRMGFDAKDTIQNLIGESSKIMFTSRTLPIKQNTLVSCLLVKDAIFYSFTFLIPILTGVIIGLFATPYESGMFISAFSIPSVVTLYLMTLLFFIFGVSIGFVITTNQLGKSKSILLIIGLSVISYLGYTSIELSMVSLIKPIIVVPAILSLTLLFIFVGLRQFNSAQKSREKSTYKNEFNELKSILSYSEPQDSLIAKTLIDIKRSAGGLWKIKFSTSSVILTSAFLIYIVNEFLQLSPKPEFLFGGLFSLMAYPLYTIIFRYDGIKSYSTLPITESEIYRSKAISLAGVGIILSLLYYTPFMIFLDVGLIDAINGLIVLIGLLVYQFGVLMHIVEDEPIKFLFDGAYFALYALSILVFIIPLLIIGMHGAILPEVFGLVMTMIVLVSSLVGAILIYKKS